MQIQLRRLPWCITRQLRLSRYSALVEKLDAKASPLFTISYYTRVIRRHGARVLAFTNTALTNRSPRDDG